MALKRIGDILIKEQVITELELKDALSKQEPNERLGETLVRLEICTEMQILKALEDSTGVQRVSLQNFTIDEHVLTLIDEAFCRRNILIPLRLDGNKLMFATHDPLDFSVFEEMRMVTGYRPKAFSATKNDIL